MTYSGPIQDLLRYCTVYNIHSMRPTPYLSDAENISDNEDRR